VGVHRVVLIGDTVDVVYDVEPDESGSGLHFSFPCRSWSAPKTSTR
jgi:hypothetical protein